MLAGCTPWPEEFAARYREQGWWRGESLGDLLHQWAAHYGDATALEHGNTQLSYRDLDTTAQRAAHGFIDNGLRPGDRVVVQLPNVAEFITVAFALFRSGVIPVFSLLAHRTLEISRLLTQSEAVGYIVPAVYRGSDNVATAARMLGDIPTLERVFVAGDDADFTAAKSERIVPLSSVDADPHELPTVDASDVAFLLLSGGTTALPKLIPRTHDDYAYQIRAAAAACALSSEDVYLAALPLEFNFTWGCPGVLGTLASGGKVVLADDPTAGHCFPIIESNKVTVTSVVPTVARLWIEASEWMGDDLSSLRLVQIGGSKLTPDLAARIEPALGCRLQQVFGMAEGLLSMSREADDPRSVIETQGRPLSPGDEIRIVDEMGVDVNPGETGELLARGPYTLRGYFRADDHNRAAFTADGFYRSGDLARITPAGNLVVEGRLKDVVVRGGAKISAVEVETELVRHPLIAAAAVVPVPDDYLGERICAFVVCPGERPTLPQVKQALHDQGLADFKAPDRIEIIDAFPVTPLGKVDKAALSVAARQPGRPGRPSADADEAEGSRERARR